MQVALGEASQQGRVPIHELFHLLRQLCYVSWFASDCGIIPKCRHSVVEDEIRYFSISQILSQHRVNPVISGY